MKDHLTLLRVLGHSLIFYLKGRHQYYLVKDFLIVHAYPFGFVAQIQAGASEDLPLQLKANKDEGAHFLMIEMALA